ncbi:MAG TPA: cyclic nucleotide-binding domain-containing protein, partial [Lacipirellulaceae bacterium]|nr:cyclic nucleotide-binding domain-containing protein [Lacipirellulaceae bacterium]
RRVVFEITSMTNLLHLGNVLYLVAYSVRDMLWLRIITVVATLCLMPYYYFRDEPLYAPIAWCTLFTLVNLVQIAILILEKRPVFLGEEELHLYRTIFRSLQPREFLKLLTIARWQRAQPGDELVPQGQPVSDLLLIADGAGDVEIDGRFVARVSAGQVVGEMGFLTEQPASARVVAGAPTHYLAWPVEKLRELLNLSPALHVKVQAILGADVVAKLRREALSAAHPSQMGAFLRSAGVE